MFGLCSRRKAFFRQIATFELKLECCLSYYLFPVNSSYCPSEIVLCYTFPLQEGCLASFAIVALAKKHVLGILSKLYRYLTVTSGEIINLSHSEGKLQLRLTASVSAFFCCTAIVRVVLQTCNIFLLQDLVC